MSEIVRRTVNERRAYREGLKSARNLADSLTGLENQTIEGFVRVLDLIIESTEATER